MQVRTSRLRRLSASLRGHGASWWQVGMRTSLWSPYRLAAPCLWASLQCSPQTWKYSACLPPVGFPCSQARRAEEKGEDSRLHVAPTESSDSHSCLLSEWGSGLTMLVTFPAKGKDLVFLLRRFSGPLGSLRTHPPARETRGSRPLRVRACVEDWACPGSGSVPSRRPPRNPRPDRSSWFPPLSCSRI